MEIRELGIQELPSALELVQEVFLTDVAPLYTPQGVEEFQKFICLDAMERMRRDGEVTFFGAFDEKTLAGTIAVKPASHICLFYVKKSCQGRGIGKKLFQTARDYCARTLKAEKLTVNAAPPAVPKYIRLGMEQVEEEQTVNGMRFVPMEMYINCSENN